MEERFADVGRCEFVPLSVDEERSSEDFVVSIGRLLDVIVGGGDGGGGRRLRSSCCPITYIATSDGETGHTCIDRIGRSAGRSAGWSIDRSAGRSAGWSVGRLVGRSLGRLVCVCWLICWSVGHFGCSVGRRRGLYPPHWPSVHFDYCYRPFTSSGPPAPLARHPAVQPPRRSAAKTHRDPTSLPDRLTERIYARGFARPRRLVFCFKQVI